MHGLGLPIAIPKKQKGRPVQTNAASPLGTENSKILSLYPIPSIARRGRKVTSAEERRREKKKDISYRVGINDDAVLRRRHDVTKRRTGCCPMRRVSFRSRLGRMQKERRTCPEKTKKQVREGKGRGREADPPSLAAPPHDSGRRRWGLAERRRATLFVDPRPLGGGRSPPPAEGMMTKESLGELSSGQFTLRHFDAVAAPKPGDLSLMPSTLRLQPPSPPRIVLRNANNISSCRA